MSDPVKKLFLLDGMALAYRSHYAMLRNPPTTSIGMNTAAVFVFTNTLLDIVRNAKPTHLAVVFDTPEPTHRHRIYPEYKAQRDAMPEDLSAAMPYLFRLCDAFNMNVIRIPGWEADDVIGTLAEQAEAEDFRTFIVTPDKDFGQLVSEKTVLCRPGRTSGGMDILGTEQILERWKIGSVQQVVDILGLTGDASDNVPGVPGIGEKTAQKLISDYGTVENLLNHLDCLKGRQKENLSLHRDQALLSKRLVTIERQVPLEVKPSDLELRRWNEAALKALFRELEFNALGKRLFKDDFDADPASVGEEAGNELKTIRDTPHDYRLADSKEKREDLIKALSEQKAFCFDIETTKLDAKACGLVGLAFSFKPHSGFYVPLPEDREGAIRMLEAFHGVFTDPDIAKIGHNLKFDLSVLKWHGHRVEGPLYDTLVAAHLAVPNLRRNLDALSQALLRYRPMPISDLIGEKGKDQLSMRDVSAERVAEYASEDADITFQLWGVLRSRLDETNQKKVFSEVESPLIPVLVDMEYHGIRLDVEVLEILSEALGREIDRTAGRIFELSGEAFNLNSPKQMGTIFFEKLKLDPHARRTQKTKQYQTNERVLTRLANRHEIARKVLQYRESTKLKSTYLDTLPRSVFSETGRVHTTYEQAVTATGRMQSSNPNLQNIPIRGEQGREIRKAFVSQEGYLLMSADYSQIELRISAELSSDEGMLQGFQNEEDIHNTTGMKIYGVDEADLTPEMRRKAKTVNFGIIYGISAFGLADRLDVSRVEGASLIDQYFEQYPGVRDYMDRTIEFARENGYVETITGRRRYLPDIHSRNAIARKAAERNAINSPIQGTAADMIKIAMIKIHGAFQERDLETKMLLQVHDELVFDLHRSEADVVPGLVKEAMLTAIPMKVPIVVEVGFGENWLDAH